MEIKDIKREEKRKDFMQYDVNLIHADYHFSIYGVSYTGKPRFDRRMAA